MEDNKLERKKKRFSARLSSSKGILCTNTPSPKIVLCNAGQATGLVKNIVINLIKENRLDIPLPEFIAEKGESHSFLIFDTMDNAVLFYNTCDGKAKVAENGTPLYLNYVDKVPKTEILCSIENPMGLMLLNNFITIEEEVHFLKLFDWTTESSNLKNRHVKHYGYEFQYGSNDVDLNNPLPDKIPQECDVLWQRLIEQGFTLGVPDQLTVNKYSPGQGIPSHVDKHSPFGETILSLSLGSDVLMDWKHHSGKYVPVVVQSRSLLLMQDEARYDWQHGIQPRTHDPIIEERFLEGTQNRIKVITSDSTARGVRISLTFRWTRTGLCECQYKTLCDTANNMPTQNLEDKVASNLEELHVHQVYEQIAGHFSTTRHKPWPKVVQFMEGVSPGSVLLDLGCGNGKNILRRNDIVQLAGERSAGLLVECQQAVRGLGADCVRLDLLQVPFVDGAADVVICIAVIHHFSSYARRLQAISSIHRLLRNGGRALVTVWAKDQTKSNYLCKSKLNQASETSQTHISVGGVNLPVHENRTQFKHKDLLVPWKLRKVNNNKLANSPEETLLRYYHVFEENELDELCTEANFIIERSFYEEGNWCVICKKK